MNTFTPEELTKIISELPIQYQIFGIFAYIIAPIIIYLIIISAY